MGKHRVLIVDQNPSPYSAEECSQFYELIHRLPFSEQLHLQTTTSFSLVSTTVSPDLIILRPVRETFPAVLNSIKEKWSRAPILCIFCGEWNTTPEIFQSFHNDIDDFLLCPFKEIDFIQRIQHLLLKTKGASIYAHTRKDKGVSYLELLIGECDCFLREVKKIPILAGSDTTVLISGETGTGKELFARAIHYSGQRHRKPFIPVNCGALPDYLFENELFGHVKGAFTDASATERGLIAEAEGGTLFLDEIDTLSPSAQVKLLRFLQDRGYRPLGSAKSIIADILIIAATNSDLKHQVDTKLFREDLYYRLNALPLSLPPLRDRMGDIPSLANHFLLKYAIQYSRNTTQISLEGLQKLLNYHWPGNVRELEGVIRRAVIMSSFPVLQPDDLDLPAASQEKAQKYSSFQEAKSVAINDFERTYLTALLIAYRGNITQAAKASGKERRTFQRLLQKHGLDRNAFQKAI